MVPQVHEVEAKFRVADAQAVRVALGAFSVEWTAPVEQDDQAYAPVTWDYGQSKIGVPFARLRTQGGRHLFTVKTPGVNELACAEHESLVVDRDAMAAAVEAMGFRPTVRIRKRRQTAVFGGWTLCLDEVEGLCAFLEVEALVGEGDDTGAVQAELAAFVEGLGITAERVTETYDSLLRRAASVPA